MDGQGDWYNPYFADAMVADEITAYSGNQYASTTGNSASHWASSTVLTTSDTFFQFRYYRPTGSTHTIGIGLGQTGNYNYFQLFTSVAYFNSPGGATSTIVHSTTEVTDMWHTVTVEFDVGNGQARARYDYGDWSTWLPGAVATSTPVDFIFLESTGGTGSTLFDYITYGQTYEGSCYTYTSYTDCVADSDCYFNFPSSQCLPLDLGSTCGAGWELQFCDSEGPCEAYGGVWYNFGTGYGCYDPESLPEEWEWTDTYSEAECISLGFQWDTTFGCYATSTGDFIDIDLYNSFWDVVQDPGAYFDTLINSFDFRKKFPFSWVMSLYTIFSTEFDSVDDYSADLSDFDSQNVSLAGIGTVSLTFIDFDWIKDDGIFAEYFLVFRTILVYVFWLGFAFWLIHRVKNFSNSLKH